jgi:isoleucyl-tRNA synthetase
VYRVEVDGHDVALDADDVEVRATSHEQYALAQEGAYAVALDTTVDADLRLEGLARGFVRVVNDHRKASGFEIADRIRVWVRADDELRRALERHGDWAAQEVLATELTLVDEDGDGFSALAVDGEPLQLRVERSER